MKATVFGLALFLLPRHFFPFFAVAKVTDKGYNPSFWVQLHEHPDKYGNKRSFSGWHFPVRVDFHDCISYVSSAEVCADAALRPACFCFHDHAEGYGLSRCWRITKQCTTITNLVGTGVDNIPSSFSFRPATHVDCIGVPHFPVDAVEEVQPGCSQR